MNANKDILSQLLGQRPFYRRLQNDASYRWLFDKYVGVNVLREYQDMKQMVTQFFAVRIILISLALVGYYTLISFIGRFQIGDGTYTFPFALRMAAIFGKFCLAVYVPIVFVRSWVWRPSRRFLSEWLEKHWTQANFADDVESLAEMCFFGSVPHLRATAVYHYVPPHVLHIATEIMLDLAKSIKIKESKKNDVEEQKIVLKGYFELCQRFKIYCRQPFELRHIYAEAEALVVREQQMKQKS